MSPPSGVCLSNDSSDLGLTYGSVVGVVMPSRHFFGRSSPRSYEFSRDVPRSAPLHVAAELFVPLFCLLGVLCDSVVRTLRGGSAARIAEIQDVRRPLERRVADVVAVLLDRGELVAVVPLVAGDRAVLDQHLEAEVFQLLVVLDGGLQFRRVLVAQLVGGDVERDRLVVVLG